MGRKPRVDGTPEEKWQIVQQGRRAGTSLRLVGGTESLRRSTTVGKTKRNRERRQRLGEERCGGGNRGGSAHPATGTHARPEITENVSLPKRSDRRGIPCLRQAGSLRSVRNDD